jgi:hypothetical protein
MQQPFEIVEELVTFAAVQTETSVEHLSPSARIIAAVPTDAFRLDLSHQLVRQSRFLIILKNVE